MGYNVVMEETKIGDKPKKLYKIREVTVKDLFGFKSYFTGKFKTIILIIDYCGNMRFFLTDIKDRTIKISGNEYHVISKNIKKTNMKYGIIGFNEGNPQSIDFSHNANDVITSKQLSDFMDSELIGMILRGLKKKKTGITFFHIIILIIIGFVGLLFVLNMFGVMDIGKFFLGG